VFIFLYLLFYLKETILVDFATVSDRNGLLCFSALATEAFNLLNNIHAFNDGTEDDVTVVQPRCFHGCNEEL